MKTAKTIKISNGEIRKGFEFHGLSSESQEKALFDLIEAEIAMADENSLYTPIIEEMDENFTPWFTAGEIYKRHKDDLIDTLVDNEYLFDEDGEILPIMRYKNGTCEWNDKYPCTIE